jgi:hypothetical protein
MEDRIMARIVQETRYELADGELLALDRIGGRELACRSGELWITVDGRAEDIILGPGQRWLAEDRAPVVVSALKDSLLVVTCNCERAPRGRAESLLAALLRWRHAPLAAMPATLLR